MKVLLLDYFAAGRLGRNDCHQTISTRYLLLTIRRKKTGPDFSFSPGPLLSFSEGLQHNGGHYPPPPPTAPPTPAIFFHPLASHLSQLHIDELIDPASHSPPGLCPPLSNLSDSCLAFTNPSIFHHLFFCLGSK